jgi:hypothetical protein
MSYGRGTFLVGGLNKFSNEIHVAILGDMSIVIIIAWKMAISCILVAVVASFHDFLLNYLCNSTPFMTKSSYVYSVLLLNLIRGTGVSCRQNLQRLCYSLLSTQ